MINKSIIKIKHKNKLLKFTSCRIKKKKSKLVGEFGEIETNEQVRINIIWYERHLKFYVGCCFFNRLIYLFFNLIIIKF